MVLILDSNSEQVAHFKFATAFDLDKCLKMGQIIDFIAHVSADSRVTI